MINTIFSPALIAAAASAFEVDNSIVFDIGDVEYLEFENGNTPTNADIGTISFWFKRGQLGDARANDQCVFFHGTGGSAKLQGNLAGGTGTNADKINIGNGHATRPATQFNNTDWQHLVIRVDSSQGTEADRQRIYINGSLVTSFSNASYPSQNADVFGTDSWLIAKYGGNTVNGYDGRVAEYIYVDGQSLAPTAFGESSGGSWVPIDVSSSGLFDASNSVVPTATTWTLGSTMSAGTGTLDKSGAGGTAGLYRRTLVGDFKVTFTAAALNDALFGVFDYSEIGTFNSSQDDGFLDSMTNSFWYDEGQTDVNYGNSTVAASKTISAGSVVTIERSGSTIKITDDGADVHSFSQTFSGPVGFIAGHRNTGANSLDFNSISFDGVSGTGNNGFYLPFTNSANLGNDQSGNTSGATVLQKNTYNAGSEINEGDLAANPITAIKFVPTISGTVSKIQLNASSRGFSGVTVRLETDSGSGTAPSGTLVTNGSVSGITSSGSGLKTATFSTPPTVVAGTTYWIGLRGDTGTWGLQHDVSGVGGALGIYQGATQGYYSSRGLGHYVYMTGNHFTPVNSPTQSTDTPTS